MSVTASSPRHSTDIPDPVTLSAVPLSVLLSPSTRKRILADGKLKDHLHLMLDRASRRGKDIRLKTVELLVRRV
jgi:hypothetical protein